MGGTVRGRTAYDVVIYDDMIERLADEAERGLDPE